MTSIQDRAKLISTSVEDMAQRQIRDAVIDDPLRLHLTTFLGAVDGVYLNDGEGKPVVFIPKEEYSGIQTEDMLKLLADKRAEMLGVPNERPPEPQAEAEEG